jgi:predicted nuclease of predicted toxin-antitoxin system
MALFYANENFPIKVAEYLREMGHDVLTSYEAGNANRRIADVEVLRFAFEAGRILLTINRRDFIKLHDESPNHAGIVVCTQNTNLREQAAQIDQVVQEMDTMAGKLVRINRMQQ